MDVRYIPEVLNNFNAYDGDGDKMVGITDNMTLAEIKHVLATISGAGIGGSYEVPVAGHFEPITQEVPFRMLYDGIAKYANPLEPVDLTIRGAIQVTNRATSAADVVGIRIVLRGRNTTISLGDLKPGAAMGAKLSIAVSYILIETNDEELLMIDVHNNKCRINGVDINEKINKLC